MTEIESSTLKRWTHLFVTEDRLRPIWRFVLYIPVLAITYFIVIELSLGTLLTVLGLPRSYLLNQAMQVAAVLLGTWICRRFLDKRDMASLGFGLRRGWLLDLGIGLLLGFGLMGGIFLIEVLCGWIDVKGFAWETQAFSRFNSNLLGMIAATVMVAVLEETVSRGYQLLVLEEAFGTPVAVFITSFIFGLLHLANSTATGWARYVIPCTLTLAGVMFAMAYLVHRSLWLPIAMHFAWNLFEYDIFALTGVSSKRATFLVTELTGPAFLVGLPNSSFGPEVGALGVLAMLLGIGLLGLLRRRQSAKAQVIAAVGGVDEARSEGSAG